MGVGSKTESIPCDWRSVVVDGEVKGLSRGSGYVINPEGYVGTNYHVVENMTGICVMRPANAGVTYGFRASLVTVSEYQDLAVLRISNPDFDWPSVTFSLAELKEGQKIWSIGYPGTADRLGSGASSPTVRDGVIGRLYLRLERDGDRFLSIIQHSATINRGNSGGPMLDDCGRVVGTNTWGLDHLSGYLGGTNILEMASLLGNEGIAFARDDTGCVRREGIVGEVGGAGWKAITWQIVLTGLLLTMVLIALVWALERLRQQIAQKRVSQLVIGKREVGVGAKPVVRTAPTYGLALSGFDGRGKCIRVALPSTRFVGLHLGLSLGRHPELVDEVVDDNSVSRRHLRISQGNGALYVEDLNSTNGTFVNHRRLVPFKLESLQYDSVITLGSLELNVSKL